MTSDYGIRYLNQVIKFYFIIPVSACLAMASLGQSGKDLHAADHGAITLQDDEGRIFKANGQRLKIFLEPEQPELEEIDVFELHEAV